MSVCSVLYVEHTRSDQTIKLEDSCVCPPGGLSTQVVSRLRDFRVVPSFAMPIHSHLGTFYERQGPVMSPDSHNPSVLEGKTKGNSQRSASFATAYAASSALHQRIYPTWALARLYTVHYSLCPGHLLDSPSSGFSGSFRVPRISRVVRVICDLCQSGSSPCLRSASPRAVLYRIPCSVIGSIYCRPAVGRCLVVADFYHGVNIDPIASRRSTLYEASRRCAGSRQSGPDYWFPPSRGTVYNHCIMFPSREAFLSPSQHRYRARGKLSCHGRETHARMEGQKTLGRRSDLVADSPSDAASDCDAPPPYEEVISTGFLAGAAQLTGMVTTSRVPLPTYLVGNF